MVSAGTAACKASLAQHCLTPVAQRSCKCDSWQRPVPGHGPKSQLKGLEARRFVQVVLSAVGRKGWAGSALSEGRRSKKGLPSQGAHTGVRASASDGDRKSTATAERPSEAEDRADTLLRGMTFAELCNDFECNSSPQVRNTARQLVKDILEIKEGARSTGVFAKDVQYKDPLRSFKGRSKYRRLTYIRSALNDPVVAVQEMKMLSTSSLVIKWSFRGKPRTPPASLLPGDVVVGITSTFELNQISGQVTQQTDEWDLSGCPPQALAYFMASRLAFSTVEAGKDTGSAASKLLKKVQPEDDSQIYVDPTDPRRFFQQDDSERRDLYQGALVVALIYLGVQFLKTFVI
ncbi:hypothetical protein KFL_001910080 [Klebsormidium nitens]|uniref:Uncharacterized protein n=1 Tax=Klebsormidium nitens TaxID=105231 RepID=A0A1Y1I4Z3_KLENI|nr:hypothetical protein KFL_001910080 [Klebsormidium nitens]|eukprot:GAQ84489.1 hypothetical protein KFL_001910080 [Klebsormidium nitens]